MTLWSFPFCCIPDLISHNYFPPVPWHFRSIMARVSYSPVQNYSRFCLIALWSCLDCGKRHRVKHSACHIWTLHNKPQVTKIELQSSSTTIPFPGVYYAIICSARKQIPLTWFLFNYSTWKSFLLPLFLWTWEKEETTLPNKKKKKLKKSPLYLRNAFLPACQFPFTRTHLQHLFYLNFSKCGTKHNRGFG